VDRRSFLRINPTIAHKALMVDTFERDVLSVVGIVSHAAIELEKFATAMKTIAEQSTPTAPSPTISRRRASLSLSLSRRPRAH
jgi:hypothetical protein